MKLTSQQFNDTMCSLHEFSDSHPECNSYVGYSDGTQEASISKAVWTLNECFCEPNRITPRQRLEAINLLAAVPPTVTPEYLVELNSKRAAEYQECRDAQRQSELEERAKQACIPKVLNAKDRKAAKRAERYASDPVFRAHCDSFITQQSASV